MEESKLLINGQEVSTFLKNSNKIWEGIIVERDDGIKVVLNEQTNKWKKLSDLDNIKRVGELLYETTLGEVKPTDVTKDSLTQTLTDEILGVGKRDDKKVAQAGEKLLNTPVDKTKVDELAFQISKNPKTKDGPYKNKDEAGLATEEKIKNVVAKSAGNQNSGDQAKLDAEKEKLKQLYMKETIEVLNRLHPSLQPYLRESKNPGETVLKGLKTWGYEAPKRKSGHDSYDNPRTLTDEEYNNKIDPYDNPRTLEESLPIERMRSTDCEYAIQKYVRKNWKLYKPLLSLDKDEKISAFIKRIDRPDFPRDEFNRFAKIEGPEMTKEMIIDVIEGLNDQVLNDPEDEERRAGLKESNFKGSNFICEIYFDEGKPGVWRAKTFFNLRAKLANWVQKRAQDISPAAYYVTEAENCKELEQALNDNIELFDPKYFYRMPIKFKVKEKLKEGLFTMAALGHKPSQSIVKTAGKGIGMAFDSLTSREKEKKEKVSSHKIKCKKCGNKFLVPKGKGFINVPCPSCKGRCEVPLREADMMEIKYKLLPSEVQDTIRKFKLKGNDSDGYHKWVYENQKNFHTPKGAYDLLDGWEYYSPKYYNDDTPTHLLKEGIGDFFEDPSGFIQTKLLNRDYNKWEKERADEMRKKASGLEKYKMIDGRLQLIESEMDYEDEDYLDIPEETKKDVIKKCEELLADGRDDIIDEIKSSFELTDDDAEEFVIKAMEDYLAKTDVSVRDSIKDTEIEKSFEDSIDKFKGSDGELLDYLVDEYEIDPSEAESIWVEKKGNLSECVLAFVDIVKKRLKEHEPPQALVKDLIKCVDGGDVDDPELQEEVFKFYSDLKDEVNRLTDKYDYGKTGHFPPDDNNLTLIFKQFIRKHKVTSNTDLMDVIRKYNPHTGFYLDDTIDNWGWRELHNDLIHNTPPPKPRIGRAP